MNIRVGMSLADIEKEVIQETLRFYDNNKRRTADVLGISLKTLYNKLNEYANKWSDPNARVVRLKGGW